MKKMLNVVTSIGVAVVFLFSCVVMPSSKTVSAAAAKTASEKYVDAMGTGINLGNSFDSFDRVDHKEIDDETAWGNPVVTKEYIDSLKAKGYESIRIPFTTFTRTDNEYKINEEYLQKYQEVVDYALQDGMYVMVNLHHDSSEWLKYWDGNKSSEEYKRFVTLWQQLADRFKDYDDHLMFESINEVCFDNSVCANDDQQNERVKEINLAFYNVVRNSGGNNATRMIVLPTTYTNHGLQYSEYLADYMKQLNDKNMIATVHYYATSVYAFTCNIGLSGFDEEHPTWNTNARKEVDSFYDCLKKAFVDNGIGVVIGEYGLFNMGSKDSLEDGEVAKYIEYMNYKANDLGICTMLWECGNIIDRTSFDYTNSTWAEMIESSMEGRSSYATGLDQLFVSNATAGNDISVPLTLNGNTLKAIYNGSKKLEEGKDYTYKDNTVTLSGSYVSGVATGDYGVKADLRFVFSAGADWHEYINYEGTAVFDAVDTTIRKDDGYMASYDTDGTPTYPAFIIPVDFNGKKIDKIQSVNAAGEVKSGNTWANDYLQCGGEFKADYSKNELALMNWYNNAIPDDTYTLKITFYDGTTANYKFTKAGDKITGAQVTDSNVEYSLNTIQDWKSGCKCELTITNTTGKDFKDGWTVSFDYDRAITNVYGADLVSAENGHYVIHYSLANPSWKTTFAAGEKVTIQFMGGAGNSEAVVSNVVVK